MLAESLQGWMTDLSQPSPFLFITQLLSASGTGFDSDQDVAGEEVDSKRHWMGHLKTKAERPSSTLDLLGSDLGQVPFPLASYVNMQVQSFAVLSLGYYLKA